ncbi:glycosyltransferase family 39 protein [Flavobacteriaceae bacterium]|nr:glycosyltransferase family 39 protein [Flavobacteriaceae bacterium]MDC1235078.1 glycosyltransferase family 39 protein [Flavobacteriaceae bacterium]
MSHLYKITKDNKKSKAFLVFLGLFIVAFAIRFPFFFRDYIDKDESTFILMGQAWADGYLPYLTLWDLKPPLTFGYFGLMITVFGKSLWWIRMGGVFIVSATSFMVYTFLRNNNNSEKKAFILALLSLYFSSLFGSVQGVMSEHISMLFYMGGLVVWGYAFKELNHKKWVIWGLGGFFFGLSAMSKLNLAYPILLCAAYISLKFLLEKGIKNTLITSFSSGLGVLIGIGVTAVPYLRENAFQEWWKAVFLAPRAYAVFHWNTAFLLLPIVGFLTFLLAKSLQKSQNKKSDKTNYPLVLLSTIGVLGSFVMAGKVNGHYLLQCYPLIFILCAWLGFERYLSSKKAIGLFVIFCVLLPFESYKEYGAIYKNKQVHGTYYNGEGIEVPAYLKKKQRPLDNILFLEYHIGYWILDKRPPTMAVTHPSNLFRNHLFPYYNKRKTAQEELSYILDSLKPAVIVIDHKNSIFKGRGVLETQFIKKMSQRYTKDTLIGKAQLYQILPFSK